MSARSRWRTIRSLVIEGRVGDDVDEPTRNPAYAAPVAEPARAVNLATLFREPRAMAGGFLLVHCLLVGLVASA